MRTYEGSFLVAGDRELDDALRADCTSHSRVKRRRACQRSFNDDTLCRCRASRGDSAGSSRHRPFSSIDCSPPSDHSGSIEGGPSMNTRTYRGASLVAGERKLEHSFRADCMPAMWTVSSCARPCRCPICLASVVGQAVGFAPRCSGPCHTGQPAGRPCPAGPCRAAKHAR